MLFCLKCGNRVDFDVLKVNVVLVFLRVDWIVFRCCEVNVFDVIVEILFLYVFNFCNYRIILRVFLLVIGILNGV